MRARKSLEVILEGHIRKMLGRADLEPADHLKLLDIGVKLVLAQSKIQGEPDTTDGSFFQKAKGAIYAAK
jgi:hypothetical protein